MPRPCTQIASEFNGLLEGVAQTLTALESAGRTPDGERLITSLADYFNHFQALPVALQKADAGFTALFEVDRSLEGFFSEPKNRLAQDQAHELRSVVIDYSALLQKFYLLPYMAAADERYGKLPGVDRFYTRWKEGINRDSGGGEFTEYDRAVQDTGIILGKTDYSIEVRRYLLEKLGEILITLGVDLTFIQGRLHGHYDEIMSRTPVGQWAVHPEVLLNLQALHALGGDVNKTGIPPEELLKAVRFWSSRDAFLDDLFKFWRWNWLNDYVSAIAWGERSQLVDASDLFRAWSEGQTYLGVGRSYVEQHEHRMKRPTELFQPIPIFILGRSNVGKSTFFTAINYEVSSRGGDNARKLTFGQQLQAYYDTSQKIWMEGKSVPTAAYTCFDFWRDVDVVGYCTYDYRGGDAEPQQWEPALQEMFRNSRGIIFMIDDDDLASPEKMRARAAWSRTILDYWRNSNPQARHVPIALVINKTDLVIPDAMPHMPRTSLLPQNFQPAFVENHAIGRYTFESPDTQTALGRLKDCLLHDPANNVHPRLQDLVLGISQHFSQFFGRVLNVTYHYQIFLMSSRAPCEGDPAPLPWGVLKPLLWMTAILQEQHVMESLGLYEAELKSLQGDITALMEGLENLQRLREEIGGHQREMEEERKKRIRFAFTQREERIKHLQKLVTDAEADFTKTAEAFIENPVKSKDDVLAALRRKLKQKEDLCEGIEKRIKNYMMLREHADSVV